jgi:uncharacterized protein YjbI with pentapeptide repeats
VKPSELKAVLKDHRLWAESDGKQGKRADLRDASLRGANLRGASLRGANLRRASFQDAYLQGANLQGANLRGAHLQGANLDGADLQGADLVGAHLQGAKFTTNFKKVAWFDHATFSEDQIPWVVLHPKYPEWAGTLKWVKVKAEAA